MTLTAEMIAVAEELLTEFGFSVTIRQKSSSTYNAATLTATEGNTTVVGKACFFNPSNSNLSGYENTLSKDGRSGKWLYVQTNGILKTGDVIETDTAKFKIYSATPIGPTATAIIYRVATEVVT